METIKEIGPTGWSKWQTPAKDYKVQCCDCGLMHDMQFRVIGPDGIQDMRKFKIQFRARRSRSRKEK